MSKKCYAQIEKQNLKLVSPFLELHLDTLSHWRIFRTMSNREFVKVLRREIGAIAR